MRDEKEKLESELEAEKKEMELLKKQLDVIAWKLVTVDEDRAVAEEAARAAKIAKEKLISQHKAELEAEEEGKEPKGWRRLLPW